MTRLDELFAPYPKHLDIDQLCEVLDITRVTAYKWLNDGAIPAYRVQGLWKILRDDVKDFVAMGSNVPRDALPPPTDVDGA